jgi:DNA end-binding protein Ku
MIPDFRAGAGPPRNCCSCQERPHGPACLLEGLSQASLVSCPITLHPAASSSEQVSFNRINIKTGNRLKQQLVDAETGETVEKEDIGRGYEIGKGQYLPVEDDELEKSEIESTHTIEIDSFVPRPEIDDRYPVSPYYIAPTDRVGQVAFAVIRDAIRDKGMVGLGRVVLTRREHVVMLEAFDKGLLATTLLCAYEVRDQGAYFEDIPALKFASRNGPTRRPYHRYQGGPFRSEKIRGSLRDRARRAVEEETGGPSD